ncbi:NADH dehydrogenase [Alicyclobacillus hesperidum]|uniref:NADH dehydrogenase n=1 Tax=Alicyclobacillus hesperidum TaxID=89784 RepID=A0A1H2S288_9BACL|nr:NAD(P)/FAD-dependent oxidoreductase [Alicyclobacillus hesperidum]SDW25665.1 NADH dehydrogenase [Alicyclobacillus hesperidum]
MQSKIVILGAGYGGLAAAIHLEKHHIPFTLINKHSYHYFKTLLHEVAGGRHDAQTYAIDLRDVLHRDTSVIVKDVVRELDLHKNMVWTEAGYYEYDKLVIALGSQTATFGIPGLTSHAFVLDSLATAKSIREHIEASFLRYGRTGDPNDLKIVVAGGGLTGVELMGELADFAPKLLLQHQLSADDFQLTLVHAHDEILPNVHRDLRQIAMQKLQERGVRLVLNERVIGANANEVLLASGKSLHAHTFIWTGGVEAPSLLRQSGLPIDDRNRIEVDSYLQVQGHPDVFAIGDSARFTTKDGEVLPPTGQVAEQMGKHVADNIIRFCHNDTMDEFVYHDHGMVASLGPTYGVAEVGHHHATGTAALVLKDGSKMKYLMHLGGPIALLKKHKQWIEI